MSGSTVRALAALVAGATVGATTAAGTALLLYTGQGFLRAVGLLIASAVMAVAAGVWAGAPEDAAGARTLRTRNRWVAAVVALLAGGAFSAVWTVHEPLRALAFGGALAVLLILALPAYAAGALLAGLHARATMHGAGTHGDATHGDATHGDATHGDGGIAATSLAGAALGVLLATTVLIQNLEPYGIYYGAAGLMSLLSLVEPRAHTTRGVTAMTDQVALVTGVGSSGQLGYAIAHRLLAAGARVVVTDRTAEVERLAHELAGDGRVIGVTADLTSADDIARLLTVLRERFGRLDALINTVGGLTVTKPLAHTTPEEWQRELQRNAETVLRMSTAALPLLREARGAIVNFASPAGLHAVAGIGAYSAAKAAVIALTRALALEEKQHGVRVNAIAPGMIDTEQNRTSLAAAADTEPDAVFVSRDDVASVALFLASPAARAVTGETIQVLGRTLR